MLELHDVEASYGGNQVLFGVSFAVGVGEVVTLMGRNGMGKSTTVKSVMGLLPASGGTLFFEGQPIRGLPPYRIAGAGIGLVPEGRRIFPTLSVRENLIATARAGARPPAPEWTLAAIYELFPRLAERQRHLGSQLSGGEQQMLAIGRALMTNPKLVILDEATEGLAPLIRAEIWSCLERLKQAGLAILVIDKHADALARIADRHVILEKGRVAWTGDTAAFRADPGLKDRFLHV
ncbi:branched-chain amino acid transport system ATP-binding protein [Ancylobacter sp. 3268]|uniref:ABC transporter ATP-binding protein n=1 Tax=Ancylobacter sp. 3268 TaxID=2817752 RepID=UPI002864FFCC|nr:ABC transporter ATP-binding protein [Ancylobacter sp. 3268]MDR6952619.1 branched-chain amino acid transport system ATP-binding protein [Ancylobacter sp. 3268]